MKKKKKICLNMIVKNEAHVIRRCLSSVKPLIDYWVIVDTGSTDGTQEIIKSFMKDIPGELHERPFVNFAHSRNEALELARGKADYFLFIDADDRLVCSPGFTLPNLTKDYYYAIQHIKGTGDHSHFATNSVVLLMKDHPDFKWVGVLHEVISCPRQWTFCTLEGIFNEYLHDGARSQDPRRFQKDIEMLEADLMIDPTNTRNIFYLAQSYRGLGDYQKAIACYRRRASMEGWKEEVYFSLYSIGEMQRKQREAPEIFLKSLERAYCYRPSRAEPLFQMAMHFVETQNHWLGYLITKFALGIPFPAKELFAESWPYDCGIPLGFLTCACECGNYSESLQMAEKLLANPRLPREARLYARVIELISYKEAL